MAWHGWRTRRTRLLAPYLRVRRRFCCGHGIWAERSQYWTHCLQACCSRIAVHGTSNRADSRSDERQGRQGREGKAGKAGRQAGKAWQASKAPRLQPSESADCDPAQAARSLNNRPSSFPRPSLPDLPRLVATGVRELVQPVHSIAAAGLTAKEQFPANRICLKFLEKNSLGGRLLICGSPPSRGSVEAQNAWQDQICGDTSRKST